ncbi:hypothetical protein HY450_01360 [Candidatus Pacearchaeota archaeon]|nr:hypothetical protein [Candidatus Pacearchaeota archaeon]
MAKYDWGQHDWPISEISEMSSAKVKKLSRRLYAEVGKPPEKDLRIIQDMIDTFIGLESFLEEGLISVGGKNADSFSGGIAFATQKLLFCGFKQYIRFYDNEIERIDCRARAFELPSENLVIDAMWLRDAHTNERKYHVFKYWLESVETLREFLTEKGKSNF